MTMHKLFMHKFFMHKQINLINLINLFMHKHLVVLLTVGTPPLLFVFFIYLFQSQACAEQLKNATPEEVSGD